MKRVDRFFGFYGGFLFMVSVGFAIQTHNWGKFFWITIFFLSLTLIYLILRKAVLDYEKKQDEDRKKWTEGNYYTIREGCKLYNGSEEQGNFEERQSFWVNHNLALPEPQDISWAIRDAVEKISETHRIRTVIPPQSGIPDYLVVVASPKNS